MVLLDQLTALGWEIIPNSVPKSFAELAPRDKISVCWSYCCQQQDVNPCGGYWVDGMGIEYSGGLGCPLHPVGAVTRVATLLGGDKACCGMHQAVMLLHTTEEYISGFRVGLTLGHFTLPLEGEWGVGYRDALTFLKGYPQYAKRLLGGEEEDIIVGA